jgi:hypothetical protein
MINSRNGYHVFVACPSQQEEGQNVQNEEEDLFARRKGI